MGCWSWAGQGMCCYGLAMCWAGHWVIRVCENGLCCALAGHSFDWS
jgi:hypothetical protein